MTDYYTDADHIRDTLEKLGPLTRAELADKTNLPRETLAKSLYALKKQGDVIEEGDRLMLANAPETAQDAPEAAETGVGGTPAAEIGTGQARPVEEGDWNTEHKAVQSVAELVEKYQAMRKELVALRNDHRRLFDDHMALKKQRDTLNEAANIQAEAWSALVADREAYHALKEKLRGMLDAD